MLKLNTFFFYLFLYMKKMLADLDGAGVHTDDELVDLLLEAELEGGHPGQLAQQQQQVAQDLQGLGK